jgi:hypothetical protein
MDATEEIYGSLYGPMVTALESAFGVTFELWDTGGGCTALVGRFESDLTVYLTDSPESPRGHEATITDMVTRTEVGEDQIGYSVGVYRDEGSTEMAYGEFPAATVAALPLLVTVVMDAAMRGAHEATDRHGSALLEKLATSPSGLRYQIGSKGMNEVCPHPHRGQFLTPTPRRRS